MIAVTPLKKNIFSGSEGHITKPYRLGCPHIFKGLGDGFVHDGFLEADGRFVEQDVLHPVETHRSHLHQVI